MRFVSLLLAVSSLAFLTHCSELSVPHSLAKSHPQVLTGVTEYYHRGSKPSSSQPTAPLPVAKAKPSIWARITAPGAAIPRTTDPYALGSSRAKDPAITHVSSTHGPTFANSDGTTSRVVGNALVRSDGTSSTMIGNTVFHSKGTKSKIVGNTLINADGSQSSRINDNP